MVMDLFNKITKKVRQLYVHIIVNNAPVQLIKIVIIAQKDSCTFLIHAFGVINMALWIVHHALIFNTLIQK